MSHIEQLKKTIRHIYTQDKIDIILKRFKNNDIFTCVFLVVCFTGMKNGEVCALIWDNINLEKRINLYGA